MAESEIPEPNSDLYVKDEQIGIYLPVPDGKRCVTLELDYGRQQNVEGESTEDIAAYIHEHLEDTFLEFTDPIYSEKIYYRPSFIKGVTTSWIDLEALRFAKQQQETIKIQQRAQNLGLNRQERRQLVKQ